MIRTLPERCPGSAGSFRNPGLRKKNLSTFIGSPHFPISQPRSGFHLVPGGLSERTTLECPFARFVKTGMTVLDIGAHHGLYTLLASNRVGPQGRIFSFEPSTRERSALLQHIRMNRCKNVTVEVFAVGNENTDAQLFVVEGAQTGCNSLRKPAPDVSGTLNPLTVHVVKLDDWLASRKIDCVHFIKLDVEGGELEVLKGAHSLISGNPRPIILVEVQDVRTLPWGYKGVEIIDYLKTKNYVWFGLRSNGSVEETNFASIEIEGNFVACPVESLAALEPYKT